VASFLAFSLINFMCRGDELHNFVTVIRLVGVIFLGGRQYVLSRATDARSALLHFRVSQPTTILRHPVVNISLNVVRCALYERLLALVKEPRHGVNQDD
jgi:hypothetical protein